MLRQMNQIVGERRIEGRFMTACFATWQKGKRKLRIANAGQSQPLLYRDGHCEKIELTGFPLGIFEEVSYDEWNAILDPGNILVFHSDGIAETANAEGQFFGTEKIAQVDRARITNCPPRISPIDPARRGLVYAKRSAFG